MSSAPNDPPKKAAPEFLEVVRNPTARTYALIAAGGSIATAVILYLFFYSTIGAVAVFVVGVLGVLGRWTSAPVLYLILTTYFVLSPFGIPVDPGFDQVTDNHFRLADLMLLGATLVHLIGLFRYYTAIQAGMPFEAAKPYIKPGAKPTLRPSGGVSDAELWKLFIRVGVFVLLGQLVWLAVSELKFDFRRDFPIFLPTRRVFSPNVYSIPNWLSRLLLGVIFFGVAGFVIWFVSWYMRLAGMSRDEGRLAVIDTQWAEMRRDLNRPEAWRGKVKRRLVGTLPKKGCGSYFLVIGLPVLMTLVFLIAIVCAGGCD